MTTKAQPTAAPTRKMWAVIIAAFVVGGAKQVLGVVAPEISEAIPASDWIEPLAMILAGYFVKERA
jgi:hypothetical protein